MVFMSWNIFKKRYDQRGYKQEAKRHRRILHTWQSEQKSPKKTMCVWICVNYSTRLAKLLFSIFPSDE